MATLGPGALVALGPAGAGHPAGPLGQLLGAAAGLEPLQLLVRHAAHDHGDVAGALADAGGPAPGPGPPALDGRALVGEAGRDEQLLGVELVVVLGVGHGGVQHLATTMAASRSENRRMSSASWTGLPRTRSSTSRTL